MEIIVFLLFLAFTLISTVKKSQKPRQEAPRRQTAAPAPGVQTEPEPEPEPIRMPIPPAQRAAVAAAAGAIAEGLPLADDEECAGGSMPHLHTEGVDRSEHARRMKDLDMQAPEPEQPSHIPDARDLRRAVVMAEVLGRPRALKRL